MLVSAKAVYAKEVLEREQKDPKCKAQVHAVVQKLEATTQELETKNKEFSTGPGNDLKKIS